MLFGSIWLANSATGYSISNSVIFDRGSSDFLSRTPDASNRDTWTFSTWFKLGDAGSNEFGLFSGGADINNSSRLVLDASRNLKYQHFDSGGTTDHVGTTQVFRDTSAFYHVVLAVDTTQAVEANRIRIYVNGSEVTSFGTSNYPAQNADTDVNTADVHLIGSDEQPNYFSGYLAETVFIDGAQLSASSFGETNEDSGIWVPKDVSGLTFGTNGFHLNYSNSSALGADTSGNSNTWTVNNIVAADQVEDSPTNDADNDVGNYATWNSILECPHSFADGNLTASVVYDGSNKDWLICTVPVVGGSGIYYWETKATTIPGASEVMLIKSDIPNNLVQISGSNEVYGIKYQNANRQIRYNNAIVVTARNGYGVNDVIGTLLDSTNGRLYFSINDSWQDGSAGTASSATVLTQIQDTTDTSYAIPTFVGTVITGNDWFPGVDNPHSSTNVVEINFGQKAFAGTIPTNAKRLMTANLPELATTKPSDHFQNALVNTHDGSSATVTCNWDMDAFETLVMAKAVNTTDIWYFADGLRGYNKFSNLNSSGSNAGEQTNANMFAVSGTTLTLGSYWSSGDIVYVAMWKMGAAGGSSNTDGTNITSTVAVNSTAKQGIGLYTGTGNSGDSMGHGLGVIPDYWWAAGRYANASNPVQHSKCLVGGSPGDNALLMEETDAANDHPAYWNDVDATSSVVTFQANNATNGSSKTYAGYAFSDLEGYCKTFAYEGNGNADGSFVFLGFKPAMIWIKSADSTSDWHCYNNLRLGYNPDNNRSNLNGNASTKTEITADEIDILSNGFKLRIATDPNVAETYVGIAWAETPFASNNRSR